MLGFKPFLLGFSCFFLCYWYFVQHVILAASVITVGLPLNKCVNKQQLLTTSVKRMHMCNLTLHQWILHQWLLLGLWQLGRVIKWLLESARNATSTVKNKSKPDQVRLTTPVFIPSMGITKQCGQWHNPSTGNNGHHNKYCFYLLGWMLWLPYFTGLFACHWGVHPAAAVGALVCFCL